MVLDEPTTALDTTTEIQVLKLVKELRQENEMALVYITHDLTLTDINSQEADLEEIFLTYYRDKEVTA